MMHCEAMYLDYVTHGGSQLIHFLKKCVNFTKIQQCGKKQSSIFKSKINWQIQDDVGSTCTKHFKPCGIILQAIWLRFKITCGHSTRLYIDMCYQVLNWISKTCTKLQSVATKIYQFLVYWPTSLINLIKYNPHFMNGPCCKILTNFTHLCVTNVPSH